MSSRSELLTYLAQYSISIPPENVKKTFGFLTFSGGTEWNIWVNHIPLTHFRSMVSFVVRCAIWYQLYNLKNMKNTHGGVLILEKLQAEANGTKLCNASEI